MRHDISFPVRLLGVNVAQHCLKEARGRVGRLQTRWLRIWLGQRCWGSFHVKRPTVHSEGRSTERPIARLNKAMLDNLVDCAFARGAHLRAEALGSRLLAGWLGAC